MSELRTERGDAIDFVIVSGEDTAKRQDEIQRFQLSARKHGLVAFDASGEPVLTLAGHNFGRPELEMALAQIAKP